MSDSNSDAGRREVGRGAGAAFSFGSALALVMSWTAHKSVLWALLHGALSWFYVIYYLIARDDWTWF